VEELWSPILTLRAEIGRQKHTLIASVYFRRVALRVFLSQAGPQLDLEFFKLSITFGSDVGSIAFSTKKATRLGRPRLARYAPRRLAGTAPSEGKDGGGPALLVEAMPARLDRGG
jgi:hypothetical protein